MYLTPETGNVINAPATLIDWNFFISKEKKNPGLKLVFKFDLIHAQLPNGESEEIIIEKFLSFTGSEKGMAYNASILDTIGFQGDHVLDLNKEVEGYTDIGGAQVIITTQEEERNGMPWYTVKWINKPGDRPPLKLDAFKAIDEQMEKFLKLHRAKKK